MSIELKHLEGLIRLCETASPAELRQIRAKLLKQLRSNKLGRLSPRDDAKLRELWSQLNCGEPYPELPSRILGASEWSDYPVRTIAALALLGIMVFLMLGHFTPSNKPHLILIGVYDFKAKPDQNRRYVGNMSGYANSCAILNSQKTLVFNICIIDAIPFRLGRTSSPYSIMYGWSILSSKSLDDLVNEDEFLKDIWKKFSESDFTKPGLDLGYVMTHELELALNNAGRGKWVGKSNMKLDDSLNHSSEEWIISVEGLDIEGVMMGTPLVIIVKKGNFTYLIDASNKWGEITEKINGAQLADGAGIFVTFCDASSVEGFMKEYYPTWKNYDVTITYMKPPEFGTES